MFHALPWQRCCACCATVQLCISLQDIVSQCAILMYCVWHCELWLGCTHRRGRARCMQHRRDGRACDPASGPPLASAGGFAEAKGDRAARLGAERRPLLVHSTPVEGCSRHCLRQGRLDAVLRAGIMAAGTLTAVEDLYAPHRQQRTTRAERARQLGVEPLASKLHAGALAGRELARAVAAHAQTHSSTPAAVTAAIQVGQCARCPVQAFFLITELRRISWQNGRRTTPTFARWAIAAAHARALRAGSPSGWDQFARKVLWQYGKLTCKKAPKCPAAHEGQFRCSAFATRAATSALTLRPADRGCSDYIDYCQPLQRVVAHRLLAANRGSKLQALRVSNVQAAASIGAHSAYFCLY